MSTPAQRMVAEQLRPHGVTDERVLQVMSEIPREEFVLPKLRRHAYEDRALAIECGQTISQPLVVALMTQAVAPKADDIAPRSAAGSGYQAAVLSRLCRKGHHPSSERAALSRARGGDAAPVGFTNVEVAVGDGALAGLREAPTTSSWVPRCPGVPQCAHRATRRGRTLVIPVAVSPASPRISVSTRTHDGEVTFRSLFPACSCRSDG